MREDKEGGAKFEGVGGIETFFNETDKARDVLILHYILHTHYSTADAIVTDLDG